MKTCGLDVHKDTIFCAIYDGKDAVVEKFSTFTPDIEAMCVYIQAQGLDTVAMESTGIYIRVICTVMRQRGMRPVVVNPFLIKQMPGRKSDVADSVWIAKLLYNGMISDSFIPNGVLANLRVYTRQYCRMVQRRSSALTLVDQQLVGMGIRLSSCLSKITTKSFMRVAKAVAGGETDPAALEKLVHGCLKHKRDGTLRKALTGCAGEQDLWRLRKLLEIVDMYEAQIAEAEKHMEELAEANYREEMARIRTIPGISRISAMCIIAEIGADMSLFGSAQRIVGWACLRPRNDESASKYKSTAVVKGGKHLKPMLIQAAWGAVHARGSQFGAFFGRVSARRGAKKAIVAVARKLLVTIYAILRDGSEYIPLHSKTEATAAYIHKMAVLDAQRHRRLERMAAAQGIVLSELTDKLNL